MNSKYWQCNNKQIINFWNHIMLLTYLIWIVTMHIEQCYTQHVDGKNTVTKKNSCSYESSFSTITKLDIDYMMMDAWLVGTIYQKCMHRFVLLTTFLDSNSIQSNIKCLVDSALVGYHTVVDPWITTSTTVQTYHTRPPGYGEVPSCTVWWDFCFIGEVPVP